ncbi:hypothetical protein [Flavobacterium sp.]|uniref:hypothetical protein n=1 Tax=Flavobacterium sp. TaxID=239 RepID=UPI003751E74B
MKPIKFLYFILFFIFFTIVGTISHEYGHILVAKYYGFETQLHYGSMNYKNKDEDKQIEIYNRNKEAIKESGNYSEKEIYENLSSNIALKDLYVFIGGPFQTILTGTLGFIILLYRRNKIKKFGFKNLDWFFVFLTLFWLREVFNLVMSVFRAIVNNSNKYFSGDEKNIALLLEIHKGSIAIPLAIIGLIVSIYVIFKIIPKTERLHFITSGFLGGIAGFIIWMNVLGPKILP